MKRELLLTIYTIFMIVFIVVAIQTVLAITGSIGNARMILQSQTGEQIEKYVLVKNVNEVPVLIELSASGDLGSDIKITDNNFMLEPGSEKKAYFTIKVSKSGTTESRIDVKFTPEGEKNGIGLSSTIIVVANGEDIESNDNEENNDDSDTTDTPNPNDDKKDIKSNTNKDGKKLNTVLIAMIITAIMFVVFIALVIVYYKNNSLNQNKNEEKGQKLNQKKSKKV